MSQRDSAMDTIDVAQHARLMLLFDEAAELADPEREAYFEALTATDAPLAAELRALFAYDQDDRVTGAGARAFGEIVGHGHFVASERFEIVRVLGEGGMGTVYLAQQEQPWRLVALKALKSELASERVRRRFATEGDILARLSHPAIASVYEAIDGPEPYLVMEYVDGITLSEWADRTHPDLRTKIELIVKIAEAVDHAHRSGVVHRDLKPANILVTADGSPKVLDFGIARVMEPGRISESSMTQAGEIIGTPAYMSPEQASLDPSRIDHRTDVYALGVVSYELLTGYMPYPIDSDLMMNLTRIRALTPQLVGKLDPSLRGDIEVIIDKALQKQPESRYQSAAAFADDLGRWLRSETILARPPSVVYQLSRFARRNRLLVLAFGLFVLALVGGAIATTSLWLDARSARAALEHQVDDLVLLQARDTLPSDPTRSVVLLRGLSASADWPRAYAIGWDAKARGVSERTLRGHVADVEWLDIAPDGTIASASFDGTVRVWRDGVAEVYSGHVGGINRVAWSPKGVLASAGRDGTVRLWPSNKVLHQHEGECEEIAWSPDGEQIASVGGDGVLAITTLAGETREIIHGSAQLSDVAWRGGVLVASGKDGQLFRVDDPLGAAEVHRLEGHKAEVDNLAILLDARPLIATGSSDGELRIWDGDDVRSFSSPDGSPIKDIEFISRNRVAAVDRAGTLRIWDLMTGMAISLAGGGVYRDLAISPDRAWLATASDDRTAVIWDLQTLDPIVLRGHRDAVLHVAFTADHLVSGSKDGDLRIWPLPNTRTRWPLAAVGRVTAARGDAFIVVDEGGHLSQGSLASGELTQVDPEIDGHVLAWSHDGARFAASLRDGRVRFFSSAGDMLREVRVQGRPIAMLFSDSDERTAILTNDDQLVFIARDDTAPTTYPLPGARANAMAFVGDTLVLGLRDGRVMRFFAGEFSLLAQLSGDVMYVVHDGPWLAAAGTDYAQRWRIGPTWEPAGRTTHAGPIHALALSGDRMVSGDRDGLIKVLDGTTEFTLTGHTGAVTSLVMHGDALLSGGRDRSVRFWDLTTRSADTIDLFAGPIVSLSLASSAVGGPIDRVVVLADEAAISAWPLTLEHDESRVRRYLDALVRTDP